MGQNVTLEKFLDSWAGSDSARTPVAKTLVAIAGGAKTISEIVAQGQLAGELAAVVCADGHGDAQKALDVRTNDILIDALKKAPVGFIATEELELPLACEGKGPLAVALDPLDGSSNIDTNVSVGTIFSVLPAIDNGDAATSFLQPGTEQKAGGYVIYGPQCALVITVGDGVQIFTLDRTSGSFVLSSDKELRIPATTKEYAINSSNGRHWSSTIRAYVDDCVAGKDGPRGQDFNMRWIASLVAECHRILMRGGVFLYPHDARKGYEQGRIRLIYEANPIAWLIEQAGGRATNGVERILEVKPKKLHQRTPLIFGSSQEVDLIGRYETEKDTPGRRPPLFRERGLYRD